jgi:hypothetical protein
LPQELRRRFPQLRRDLVRRLEFNSRFARLRRLDIIKG